MNAASIAKTPTIQKRTIVRGRKPNANYRTREYLSEREVEWLMKAAGDNRYGHRDATMILLAFRHGLRASELCSLRWEQVDLAHGRLQSKAPCSHFWQIFHVVAVEHFQVPYSSVLS